MADFIQGLDPTKLVLFETVLSFAVAPFTAPIYNLPLFLFATVVQEIPDAQNSLKTFIGLLGGSVVLDIIWMIRNDQNPIIRIISLVILVAKFPTWLAFANGVRQAGGSFGGLNVAGNDLGGATIWSMPGGFTSAGRNGYQNVDDPVPNTHVNKPPVPPPAPAGQPAVGGYQTV